MPTDRTGREGKNSCFERVFRFFLSDASDDLSLLNLWIQSYQHRTQVGNLQRYLKLYCEPEDRTYYVACAYGFCEILRALTNGNRQRNREKGWHLAAENNEGEALKMLLSNRSEDEMSIFLVAVVALNMDLDTLDWVLGESRIEATNLVDELVTYRELGSEIVESLVARYKHPEVSRTILEYGARFCFGSTFESILPQNDDTGTSWDMLFEKAGHESNLEVMILLLDKQDLQINPNTMRAIAKSGDEKAMQLRLDREGSREITSEVNQNEKVLGLLLDRGDCDGTSTEAINRAIENCNEKGLSLLLDIGYPMSQTLCQ